MGVYEGRGQLAKAIKTLTMRWQETRMSWDDQLARRFEERFLKPLEMDLRSAVGAMEHMATMLHQIHRDCE